MEYLSQRITLRIPADLHQELLKAAEEKGSSMNAEIISRLRVPSKSGGAELAFLTEAKLKRLMHEVLLEAGLSK